MSPKDVGPRQIRILGDGFEHDNRFYSYQDVRHLSFAKQVVASSMNAMPTNKEFDAQLVIHLSCDPNEIRVRVNSYKAFYLFRKREDTGELFKEIDELYSALSEHTLNHRLESYLSELDESGFFSYAGVRFYPDGTISAGKLSVHLSDASFARDNETPATMIIKQLSRKKGLRDLLTGTPSISLNIETDFDCLQALLNEIENWI